jgi:hypothetical protein
MWFLRWGQIAYYRFGLILATFYLCIINPFKSVTY